MSDRTIIGVGCSHTAGSEIDGFGDSEYNREHSFVAKLAHKLDANCINFGMPGGSNEYIFHTVNRIIADISADSKLLAPAGKNHEYIFIIGWTSLERTTLRYDQNNSYYHNSCGDSLRLDRKLYPFCVGQDTNLIQQKDLRDMVEKYDYLLCQREKMANDLPAYMLSLQAILAKNNIKYYMFNSIDNCILTDVNRELYSMIDTKYFKGPSNRDYSYWHICHKVKKYPIVGKLWHLGEYAHEYWANYLYKEIKNAYPNL